MDSNFERYRCYDNTCSQPITASFEMNSTTDWCYRIIADTPFAGASADADFCLTSVGGLGTTQPTIDSANCSLAVSKCALPVDVTASTYQTSNSNPTPGVCYENGCVPKCCDPNEYQNGYCPFALDKRDET